MVQPLGEAHAREHLPGELVGIGMVRELERQHHVLQRVERRQELERLEDEAEHAAAQLGAPVFVQREEIDAVQLHRTARRRVEPGEQREQRRFAGA